jgi:S-adenosyl-L-methionine hydrolase (adenosine-forming)
VTVIDLTHQIPVFDVRAGALTLARSVPHLGSGVVLAVVDPGVGSGRRGVCLQVGSGGPSPGPRFFVGPDNGLLTAAADLVGGGVIARAVELERDTGRGGAITFDGRDLFAPTAGALCRGVPMEDLGPVIDPAGLVRLPPPVVESGRRADGRHTLRVEITWVDRFGNLQLAARSLESAESADSPTLHGGTVELSPAGSRGDRHTLRRVETFADLAPAELGLLHDANGHLAVVAAQASAAHELKVTAGDVVELTWIDLNMT